MALYRGRPPKTNVDVALVTLPRRSPHIYYATQLPEALARLSACTNDGGFTSQCWDFDNWYYHKSLYHKTIMDELEDYFKEVQTRRYYGQKTKLSKEALSFYEGYLDECVEKTLSSNPRWVAISIFSEQSLRCSIDYLEKLRAKAPHVRVVCGGYCMNIWAYYSTGYVLGDETMTPIRIGDYLRTLGLVDYFVCGEGEVALVELLKGNISYPGINTYTPIQIADLDALPLPDYRDFDFAKYVFPDPSNLPNLILPMVSITGSRGCVRHCVFCDITNKWPKFRWASPEYLAEETIHYVETYGVIRFHWSDSIVNASPPMLRKYLELMVEWQKKSGVQLYHSGQFIVREANQMPEDIFPLLWEAGFRRLIFGVESGSENVRNAMRKKYSQEAIHHCIRECRKNGIIAQNLLITGYPTETWEDFMETVGLIAQYANDDGLVEFCLSSFGMEVDWDESPLNKDPSLHGITFDPILGWCSPVLNNYVALKRTKALYAFMAEIGYKNYQEWEDENEADLRILEDNLRAAGREAEIIPDIRIQL